MADSIGFGCHNKLATDVPLAVLTSSVWRLPQYLSFRKETHSQWPLKDRDRNAKGNPCSKSDPSGLSEQWISQYVQFLNSVDRHLSLRLQWQLLFWVTESFVKRQYSTTAWFPNRTVDAEATLLAWIGVHYVICRSTLVYSFLAPYETAMHIQNLIENLLKCFI